MQINYNNCTHYLQFHTFAVCLFNLPKMLPPQDACKFSGIDLGFCRNSNKCGDHRSTASTASTTSGLQTMRKSSSTWKLRETREQHLCSLTLRIQVAFQSSQRTRHLRTRRWSCGHNSHNAIFNKAGWDWWKTRELRQSVGVV